MSEAEWRFTREEKMDDMSEAVIKAGMMYRFDNSWFFEEFFLNTIAIIHENDLAWKDYIHFLDTFPKTEWFGNTALFKIASALVWCHRTYNKINLEVNDVAWCVEMLRTTIQIYVMECHNEVFSEEELTQWGRNRENWLPFEVAISNYLGQQETLNQDTVD